MSKLGKSSGHNSVDNLTGVCMQEPTGTTKKHRCEKKI